jgi:holo-[acyl-carrier protein] synthase
MEKTPKLREDLFTPNEISYCESKANKYQHYAARFCAKESFLKALGTGLIKGMKFVDIEVYHDKNNKPNIRLSGYTEEFSRRERISKFLLSLAHIKDIAKAVVIIEKDD